MLLLVVVVVVVFFFLGVNVLGWIFMLFLVVLMICVVILCVEFIESCEVYVLINIGKFKLVMIVYLFLCVLNKLLIWLNGVLF